ncbi:BglG family transcription antiterminator [Lacrimispora sp. JR3]|uniref:BglG family transcription antiterminator n=1 Tax=Lacrimispora sinapis TaxID=3111456 RepID=UPI003749D41D
MDISKSAAYLLIQNCQVWLNEKQLEENPAQQRREIFIGKGELKQKLKTILSEASCEEFDFSPRERRIYIIVLLIREKHVQTHEIMERFRISRNTCILDFAGVNRILNTFRVGYTAGNHGYALMGEEYDIYRLSLWVTSKIFSELYPKNYEMAMSLFEFPKKDIEKIYQMLGNAARQFELFASREAMYTFCACCTLVSGRLRLGHWISEEMIPGYYQMSTHNYRVRNILFQIGVVGAVLGKQEADEGRQGLAECLARMFVCVCEETGDDLASVPVKEENFVNDAVQIVQRFEMYIGMLFEHKEELKKNVTLSLKCILLRKKYGFRVCNSLAREVKKHYIHIIRLTQKSVEGIPGLLGSLTEEDCVLLSINFLGGMLKTRRVTVHTPHILVVYGGNSDISVLLQGQIQNLLPGARVLTASLFQDLIRFSEYMDIIVSTIPIEIQGIPVIVVNTFLTDYDKDRIKKMIEHKISGDEDLLRFFKDFARMSEEFIRLEDRIYLRHKMEEYFKINRVKINYGTERRQGLKDLLTENRIRIVDSVTDWQEAVRMAAKPLEEDQSIDPAYTEAMILSVVNLGPYIVLSPGIALPQARPEAGVRTLSMSLLKVKKRVYFTKEKYANLFFVLASADGSSHLEALRELSAIFSGEAAYDRFMKADTVEKLHQLIL